MKKFIVVCLIFFAFSTMFKFIANAQGVKVGGVQVGGYLQTWYYLYKENPAPRYPEDNEVEDGIVAGMRIKRAIVTLKTELNEVFSVNILLNFPDQNRNLYDFSVTAKIFPELIVTFGQFVSPCQTYETSGKMSFTKLALYEVSDIANNLSANTGYEGYRDIGIMVNGALANIFRYYLYYGSGNGRLFFAETNILNKKLSDGLYGGRLEVEPIKGLNIGGHYAINNQENLYTSNGIINKDRNSMSVDLATQGLGLPFISTIISYGMGQVKDKGSAAFDYNGLSATLFVDLSKRVQLTGRFDTYNRKPEIGEESNYNNIGFGLNWTYYKGTDDIFKLGLQYHIKNEDQNKIDNNALLIYSQVKF